MPSRYSPLRRKSKQLLFTVASLCALCTPIAHAQYIDHEKSDDTWHTIKSPHFDVHFQTGTASIAKQAAAYAEDSYAELTQWFNWTPSGAVQLILSDETDEANGWATALPYNQTRIFLSPPDRLNTLEEYDSWLRLVIEHELTHIVHLDKRAGVPNTLSNIFGRFLFVFPAQFQPSWLIEGLAVYHETDKEKHVGRGQSSLYEMIMRTAVRENTIADLETVNADWKSWPLGKAYPYGTYFYQFLQERYGEAAIQQWVAHYADNAIPYLLNQSAKQAFGKDYNALWVEFKAYLTDRFTPQIQHLESTTGENSATQITDTGLEANAYQLFQDSLFYIRNDGYTPTTLIERRKDGTERTVATLNNDGPFDINHDGEIVISQYQRGDDCAYQDLYLIQAGELKRLTDCQRYRRVQWLPDGSGLIAQQIHLGISQLDQLDRNGKYVKTLWQARDNDTVLSDYDISEDGRFIIASIKRAQHSWNLARFDIVKQRWSTVTRNAHNEVQPTLVDDGKGVIYSADYQGVYNLYHYTFESQQVQQLSRVITGAFSPQRNNAGQLVYQQYHHRGYDLYQRPYKAEPVTIDSLVEPIAPAQPVTLNNVPLTTQSDYAPWPSLRPRYWLPLFTVTEDGSMVGAMTSGQDAVGEHFYAAQLQASNIGDKNELYGRFDYSYQGAINLSVVREPNLSLDDDGNVERLRASEDLTLSLIDLPIAYDGQLNLHLGAMYGRDVDRHRQPSIAPKPTIKKARGGFALTFNNTRTPLYSAAPTSGRRVAAIYESHDITRNDYRGQQHQLRWTEHFSPANQHTLAVQLHLAHADDNAEPIGVGGETVNTPLFGNDERHLRGYRDNTFIARDIRAGSVSWQLPSYQIERTWGMFPLGVQEINTNVFVDAAQIQDALNPLYENQTYTGAGIEITPTLNIGFAFNVPITLGYAHGFDKDLGRDRAYLRTQFAF